MTPPRIKPGDVGRMPRGWKPGPRLQDVLIDKAKQDPEVRNRMVKTLLDPSLEWFAKEEPVSERELIQALRAAHALSTGSDRYREVRERLVQFVCDNPSKPINGKDAQTLASVLRRKSDYFLTGTEDLRVELEEISKAWNKNSRPPQKQGRGRKLDEWAERKIAAMELLVKCGEKCCKAAQIVSKALYDHYGHSAETDTILREYMRYKKRAPGWLDGWLFAAARHLLAAIEPISATAGLSQSARGPAPSLRKGPHPPQALRPRRRALLS